MPTTFNVIHLGVLPDMDTTEGNTTAEQAEALVGLTIGGFGDALAGRIQTLSPEWLGFNGVYDQNHLKLTNLFQPNSFSIDGGAPQGFDGLAEYVATITYLDGTTAEITAVVFQDFNGNAYLAPELGFNDDQAALEAGPLLSITFERLTEGGDVSNGLESNRQSFDFVPCFVAGTRLATPEGWRPIETLSVGELVMTQDHGLEPIRWIGQTTCTAEGALAPIRIRAGALGQGLPVRDLLVSPQHRMLLRSRIAERMTGAREVLVPAKKLLDLPGIDVADDLQTVTYLHMMFDEHEIIFAEGALTESLLPGPQAMAALGAEAEAELRALFPDLTARGAVSARPIPQGGLQRRLVMRHLANRKPVVRG